MCESTIEENILKKANQKRMLGDIAIEGGVFTTDFFKEVCHSRGIKCGNYVPVCATCTTYRQLFEIFSKLSKR